MRWNSLTRDLLGRVNDAFIFPHLQRSNRTVSEAKRQHVSTTHNPLLAYFGKEPNQCLSKLYLDGTSDESLGLEVASSDDETFEKKTWAEEDEELEDQEEEEEDVSAGEQLLSSPVRPNHFALFRAVASQPTQSTAINDSETGLFQPSCRVLMFTSSFFRVRRWQRGVYAHYNSGFLTGTQSCSSKK